MSFIIAAVQARVDCAAGFASGSLACLVVAPYW
jgi:hypothetical protein